MNGVRLTILLVFGVFAVLVVSSPRKPARAFSFLKLVLLLAASGLVLAPFLWLVAAVFKDKSVLNEYVFFPPLSEWSARTLNLNNFRELLAGKTSVSGTVYFWQYLLNSLFLGSASAVLQLFFCSLAGYAVAKYDFRGKAGLLAFMLGSLTIPGVLLMPPIYELLVRIHLIDSYSGVVLPGMVSAYGIFLFRQAMQSIPNELIDAGRVDGCGEFWIYLRLVMPLVRPTSAAFCLMSFLASWNSFFAPSVLLQTQSKLTVPVVLNLYIAQYANDYGVFLAGTVLAIVPPAILFFALQREFVSGLVSGAVKG